MKKFDEINQSANIVSRTKQVFRGEYTKQNLSRIIKTAYLKYFSPSPPSENLLPRATRHSKHSLHESRNHFQSFS